MGCLDTTHLQVDAVLHDTLPGYHPPTGGCSTPGHTAWIPPTSRGMQYSRTHCLDTTHLQEVDAVLQDTLPGYHPPAGGGCSTPGHTAWIPSTCRRWMQYSRTHCLDTIHLQEVDAVLQDTLPGYHPP